MKLSELCIRRPVFATVLSLVIVLIGLVSYERLTIREYPEDRPAGGQRADHLQGRQPRDHGEPGHPAAGGVAVGHRGHRLHDLDQPAGAVEHHGHVQPRPRPLGRGGRRARPGEPRAQAASRRHRRADHREGRGRRPVDDLPHPVLRPAQLDGDQRFPRPPREGPAPGPARRRAGAHFRRAALFHAHLARPRPHGRLRRDAAGRRDGAAPARTSRCRPGASKASTASSRCCRRPICGHRPSSTRW